MFLYLLPSMQMKGKEYTTPLDLWRSGYTGEVTVWSTVKSPEGFKRIVRSLYRMDKVRLVREPDDTDLAKMLSSNDSDELQVVELQRSFSSANACLGHISVDKDAKVELEEDPPVAGNYSFAKILSLGDLPMDITVSHLSDSRRGDDMSESDMILICQSPFTVLKECVYIVTYVSTCETDPEKSAKHDGKSFEIPFFKPVNIRLAKDSFTVPNDFRKPKPRVYKLSSEAYYQLTGDALHDDDYVDIDEVFRAVVDPDRHVPIRTPPETPPTSPRPTTRQPHSYYTTESGPPSIPPKPTEISSAPPPVYPRQRRQSEPTTLTNANPHLPITRTHQSESLEMNTPSSPPNPGTLQKRPVPAPRNTLQRSKTTVVTSTPRRIPPPPPVR